MISAFIDTCVAVHPVCALCGWTWLIFLDCKSSVQGLLILSVLYRIGRAIYRAMGLLTTASPCALVLVPLAYVSAIAAITSR